MSLEFGGADAATSRLTEVTAGGSADTMGSWVELVASATDDVAWLVVDAMAVTGNGAYVFKVEIGTGGAGSETAVLGFFLPSGRAANAESSKFLVPVNIAAGTRISARCQCSIANGVVMVAVGLASFDDYGTGAGTELIGMSGSAGTVIDPGAVDDTKGSWVELAASSGRDYDYIVVFFGVDENMGQANLTFLVDIGVGASGSEVVVVEDMLHRTYIGEVGHTLCHATFCAIPSGSRIAARCQCSSTSDAADRLIDVAVLGVTITAPSGGAGGSSSRRPRLQTFN